MRAHLSTHAAVFHNGLQISRLSLTGCAVAEGKFLTQGDHLFAGQRGVARVERRALRYMTRALKVPRWPADDELVHAPNVGLCVTRVFPYERLDSTEKMNEPALGTRDAVFTILKYEPCKKAYDIRPSDVWRAFEGMRL